MRTTKDIINEHGIFKAACIKFETTSQVEQLVEECASLICAVNHVRRGKKPLRELIGNMVDIQISLEQMEILFDAEVWDEILVEKMKNLGTKIEGGV